MALKGKIYHLQCDFTFEVTCVGKSNQMMPNYANYAHLILLNTHHTNTKAYMQSWAVDYAYDQIIYLVSEQGNANKLLAMEVLYVDNMLILGSYGVTYL